MKNQQAFFGQNSGRGNENFMFAQQGNKGAQAQRNNNNAQMVPGRN